MAFFDKIFSTKRKLDDDCIESRDRGRSHKITPEQVRLLLYKECDWRGRKLLFDSSTIQKLPANKYDKPASKQTNEIPYIVEVSNGYSYLYKGPAEDAGVLGEMIFGAVAMSYKGVALKIHIMDDPRRLMCTKLFCVPTSRRVSRADWTRSSDVIAPRAGTGVRGEDVALTFAVDRGDSGFCGEHSLHSSVSSTCDFFSMFEDWDGNFSPDDVYTFNSPPGRKLSASSNGSWQRRTFRSIATKFDLGSSSNLLSVPTSVSNGTSCDSQMYSNGSVTGTSDSLTSGGSLSPQRKSKLGLALLITVADSDDVDVVRKCLEYSSQLHSLVCRLRLSSIEAGAGNFVATLHRATAEAAQWLSDLMYGPRLQPMWLGIASSQRGSSKLAESLLTDLCFVLAVGDTKSTNFFISTLLTHVLTFHLGWVTTVSPYDVLNPQNSNDFTDSKRPYNALWAQLNDLCGSIGFPPRSAKTIISGSTNIQFVNRLLTVLTYFVRCGEVTRQDFEYENSIPKQIKVVNVNVTEKSGQVSSGLKRTSTHVKELTEEDCLQVLNSCENDSSDTLVSSELGVKRSATLANFPNMLSSAQLTDYRSAEVPMTSQLKTEPTASRSLKYNSSFNSTESEEEKKVVFVLGDDERLVGLKNKSIGGRSVKKSSKIHLEENERIDVAKDSCSSNKSERSNESPSKCCSQTLQHSKPLKHSGFKFEFDKYPQIVTNYMKSKNLEILDRHYIGKPGNLKLDNFQFDPTIVPPIQEERCETCYQCQLMELTLQTPTNASELEFMNDMPRASEPQYAREKIVKDNESIAMSPKSFLRKRKENTILVNVTEFSDELKPGLSLRSSECKSVDKSERLPESKVEKKEKEMGVRQVIEFPVSPISKCDKCSTEMSGFDASLLGGVTDHYVPDLVLQGTQASPKVWEADLRRDLDLATYLNKTLEAPIQSVAIIGDTNTWEVKVLGPETYGASGMSALVGAMLDALPHMWRAKVPAHQCLLFLETKLREFCVISKTLADMLMSTDFIDIATLTKALNIDINDVPLLLAVATTHTPQVAKRYGISFR